ncbi:MAG: 2TM domain-containing protein [Saprospiraceae bacterium]|nr:2TM domain-containing protein [Saprospiraceae bacterium]
MSDMYKAAKKRAKRKVRFYKHLKSFVIINVVFFFITFTNGDGLSWLNVTMLWGIGLALQYLSVFGLPGTNGMLSKHWEEDLVEEEFAKIKKETYNEELDLNRPKRKEAVKAHWNEKDFV